MSAAPQVDELAQAPGHAIVRIPALRTAARDSLLNHLRLGQGIAFTAPYYVAKTTGNPVLLIDGFDIQFRSGTPREVAKGIILRSGAQLVRTAFPDSGYFSFRGSYPKGVDPLRFLDSLASHSAIEWVSPAMISSWAPHAPPADPFYNLQFHLFNTVTSSGGVPIDVNAEPAWSQTTGSSRSD
jgi:hypothetical protein